MKSILIIEDDACIAELISDSLSPHSCTHVTSISAFHNEINSKNFDFFVIDLDLSSNEYSGIDCLNIIKEKKTIGTTIIYSGMDASYVKKIAPNSDHIVEKPFLSQIKKIIGNTKKFENLTSLQVFNLLTSTYHHHFRNKLTVLSFLIEKHNLEKGRNQIEFLVNLLNDIEENKLDIVKYVNNDNCKILDYPLKR